MEKQLREYRSSDIAFVGDTAHCEKAPILVFSAPDSNLRPLDTYPLIGQSKDLRRILPLEDDDPFFISFGERMRELSDNNQQRLCLYEIQSPFIVLKDLLDKNGNAGRIYEFLTLDPYSVLLAQDSICVDLINIATRCLLDGKADGICLRVEGDDMVSREEYEKYVAPVETHFLDEINRFGRKHILRIRGGAGIANYQDYPAAMIIMDVENIAETSF